MTGNIKPIPVVVVIATSGLRTEMMLERALTSVYRQTLIPLEIIIIDDNEVEEQAAQSEEFLNIALGIQDLREKWLSDKFEQLKGKRDCFEDFYQTSLYSNQRTSGFSGTGAWNTAAFFAMDHFPKRLFIAILDDDDEWERNYLERQWETVVEAKEKLIAAVVSGFLRVEPNRTVPVRMTAKDENKETFFIKNPGLQGSNLFIDLQVFWVIGGFDESLRSTTDRDIAIRLMEFLAVEPSYSILYTKAHLLKHYTISDERVTSNAAIKKEGLDVFYRKYFHQFSATAQASSLKRAKRLFQYSPTIEQAKRTISSHEIQKKGRPFHLVVGTITSSSTNLTKLLASFLFLIERDETALLSHSFLILINGTYTAELKKIVANYEWKLNLKIIAKKGAKKSIATNRTRLQKAVYAAGTTNSGQDFVAWIIDDDHLFCCDTEAGIQVPDYFACIARHRESGVDALFGSITDAPPLPFMSTIRTQLLDYYYTMMLLLNRENLNKEQKTRTIFPDFYYDLSRNHFQHLEYPYFHSMEHGKQSVKDFLLASLDLAQGQAVSRKLKVDAKKLGRLGECSIFRGGNTIIYTPKLLLTPNYTPSKGYNRRSDFNWAIINRALGYDLRQVELPLKHDRSLQSVTSTISTEKLEADVKGMIFYRILIHILEEEYEVEELIQLFESLKTAVFHRIYLSNLRSELLIKLSLAALQKAKEQYKDAALIDLLEKNEKMLAILSQKIQQIKQFHLDKKKSIRLTKKDLSAIEKDIIQLKNTLK